MKTQIKKAVITAAGKGTRQYPATNAVQKELFPVVDVDGTTKPTIQVIAEQALDAGIEEIAIIVQPGEEKQFIAHFQGLSVDEKINFQNKEWGIRQSDLLEKLQERITYIHQTTQEGFGHAVYCAHKWVGDGPFLLLLGDHIYLSENQNSCIKQALNGFQLLQKTVFPVTQTPADLLYLFGAVAGEHAEGIDNVYKITSVYEKPSADYARKNLQTAGLVHDHFLSFFGMYLFTPTIFEILGNHIKNNIRSNNEIQLATAQAELCKTEGAYALEIDGERLDMGTPFGYLETLAKLALHGVYKKEFKKF
jgi:UTP--glucose-1-phosphate uridylyltransferase